MDRNLTDISSGIADDLLQEKSGFFFAPFVEPYKRDSLLEMYDLCFCDRVSGIDCVIRAVIAGIGGRCEFFRLPPIFHAT